MSLILTTLEKAVLPEKPALESFEKRMPKDSVIRAFQAGTSQLIDERAYINAKKSLSRPTDIAVLKRESFFVDTVRKINPTPNVVSSAKISLNFSTFAFSFLVSETINEVNYIDMAREMGHAIWEGVMSTMYWDDVKSLEVLLTAYLESNKYTALPTGTTPGVTPVGGAYEMKLEDYLIKAPVVMEELENYGPYADVSNIGAAARQREIATYGRYNQQNLDQYNEQFEYYKSKRIVVPDGKIESHFLFPTNSVGIVNWVEPDARNRNNPHDGEFSVVRDPFVGLDWGVFVTKERADLSGTWGPGTERAVTTRFDFATSIAPVSAYSSQAGVTPIVKMNLFQA